MYRLRRNRCSDLVADVEDYPSFLPHCVALRVVSNDVDDGQGQCTTDMIVAYKVFREKFRSLVDLDKKNGRIDVSYVHGPFRHLTNAWQFTDLPEGGSRIDFNIDFEFHSVLLQATAMAVFERAFVKMSDAFVRRAYEMYEHQEDDVIASSMS